MNGKPDDLINYQFGLQALDTVSDILSHLIG